MMDIWYSTSNKSSSPSWSWKWSIKYLYQFWYCWHSNRDVAVAVITSKQKWLIKKKKKVNKNGRAKLPDSLNHWKKSKTFKLDMEPDFRRLEFGWKMVLPGVLVNFELKSWLWHELDIILLLLFTTSEEIQINANSIGQSSCAWAWFLGLV